VSYQTLIDTNLNRAFNLLKDLAIDSTLTLKPNPSFNFGTETSEFGTSTNVVTKAIIVSKEKKAKDRNTVETKIMVKTKEVGDLTRYSTIQINSQTWNIGDVSKDNGFISLVNIYREV
jgi:hypothetical protein